MHNMVYIENMDQRITSKIVFILIAALTNMASFCDSENEEVRTEKGVRETQEHLIRHATELLESSRIYLGEATSQAEREAWEESIEAWEKALNMARKAENGRSDPNWDPDVWKAAQDAWEKAAAFRRPSVEDCERERDELRKGQTPPGEGEANSDLICGE